MKKQFMIQPNNIIERINFYYYIHNKYNLLEHFTKEEMISSKFPYVVDFNDNSFWVCESITCCACAAQNKQIISIDEFKRLERK